ncbi:MAG: phenylalanine--tRNA ligase subunit beta [Chloroflexi bacterium]|nr:phenylalanine--tRNA ligase subunit beta [Chloroflexota bacterium]
MRVSLSWLRDYVDMTLPRDDLARRLAQAGLEAGSVEIIGGQWDKIQVGHVTEVKPHPNADRLRLVTVALGDRMPTVVCGAPNVAVGQKIAFASVGAKLVDGHTGQPATLKPAKIRGVVSEGMVCSEKELGLSGDHTGILVLPADAPVGAALADLLGDTIFDIEVTPNRPDCLSVIGIAREVSALTSQPLHLPQIAYKEGREQVSGLASVDVVDPDLCPRYCAGVITNVKIGPSPEWLQRRLQAGGMRPINNVVDITNYVMLEHGQPLHAFDYAKLTDRKIVVRRARQGESLTSLDGVERPLNCEMLVIADSRRPVALAGVMGGANSEVSEATTAVLLESANFKRESVRETAAALNMRSEASARFEKGLSPELPVPALRRAMQLMVELAGGEAASGIIDVYPGKRERPPILFPASETKRLLGMELPVEKIKSVLESLGFGVEMAAPAQMSVNVPWWRTDVSQGADLVEEVARIVGYDQIPTTIMDAPIPPLEPSPLLSMKRTLTDLLVAAGMQEVITYSLISLEGLKRTTPDLDLPGPKPVRVSNPMSREHEYLRTSLRPRLLFHIAQNQRFEEGIKLFEIGHVYYPRHSDLPQEVETLCGAMWGLKQEMSWRTKPMPADFYDAKGALDAALVRLGVEAKYVKAEDVGLRSGACADIVVRGLKIGVIGEVHPKVVENFDAAGPVFLFEIDLEKLLPHAGTGVEYKPLPRFPATVRDMALVVDLGVQYQSIVDIVQDFPLVSRVALFDVYSGEQVPRGKKSLAFRIWYQSPDHTLTDEEVNGVQQRMLSALESKLGAVLRA